MRRYDLLYVIPAILALFCISVYLIGLYPSPARPGIEYVIPAVGFSLSRPIMGISLYDGTIHSVLRL